MQSASPEKSGRRIAVLKRIPAGLFVIGVSAIVAGWWIGNASRPSVVVEMSSEVIKADAYGPEVGLAATLVNRSGKDVRVLGSYGTCGPSGCVELATPKCPFTIPAKGSRVIAINYVPKRCGEHIKPLPLFLDDPQQSSVTVELRSNVREQENKSTAAL